MTVKKSSDLWLARQAKDPFVKQAKAQGLRSRASFKLLSLQEKYNLFRPGMRVIELGAAPGGWTQVLRPLLGPNGKLLALDCLPMEKVSGVDIICGDLLEASVQEEVGIWLGDKRADWVISDMAPNLSGIRANDQARALELNELCLHLALRWLRPGASGFLIKVFQGSELSDFVAGLKKVFKQVSYCKPAASRAASRECYILARALR